MKIKDRKIIAMAVVLGISFLAVTASIPPAKTSPNPDLEAGDIIQVRCRDAGIWNLHYWTHTMLCFSNNSGVVTVIHSDGEGVHREDLDEELLDLEEDFGPIENIAYLRVKSEENADIDAVLNFAYEKELEERGFDMRSLYLFTKQRNPPLGLRVSGYYCTELVWASFLCGTNVNIEYSPDIFWVNPLEIYHDNSLQKIRIDDPDAVPSQTAD